MGLYLYSHSRPREHSSDLDRETFNREGSVGLSVEVIISDISKYFLNRSQKTFTVKKRLLNLTSELLFIKRYY